MAKSNIQKSQGLKLWLEYLTPEKNFFIVSLIYSAVISLLSLAIPISVQSLVNTVTFAVLKQPLLVITFLLLVLLVFSGVLNGLQDLVVEYFQRHFYARMTLSLSQRLLNAKESSLKQFYRSDLINRYFDIMTVQKKGAKLMVGGVSMILQTMVGMILLAFYHPYFLAFDLILIFLLYLVWSLFGKKALDSAIYESKAKYKVGSWLDQVTNQNKFFKSESRKAEATNVTEKYVNLYLEKRREHFKYLFKQVVFLLAIYAFLSALILGLGGLLVMEGQLTLGQLVAAEIVVAVILSGFAKAGDYLETVYDLHASLDKLADFSSLEEEKNPARDSLEFQSANLTLKDVAVDFGPYSYSFNRDFESGLSYLIQEDFDSTQRIFLDLIHGDLKPQRGDIYFGGFNFEEINPCTLREHIYLLDEPSVVEGTIEENLIWGLKDISESQINQVLDLVELSSFVETLPEGLDTLIWPGTDLLFWGDVVRLEIARVLLKKPKWVVLSTLFQQIPKETQEKILVALKKYQIGVIAFSTGYGTKPQSFDEEFSFSRTSRVKGKGVEGQ